MRFEALRAAPLFYTLLRHVAFADIVYYNATEYTEEHLGHRPFQSCQSSTNPLSSQLTPATFSRLQTGLAYSHCMPHPCLASICSSSTRTGRGGVPLYSTPSRESLSYLQHSPTKNMTTTSRTIRPSSWCPMATMFFRISVRSFCRLETGLPFG